jgi:hypothetical protein
MMEVHKVRQSDGARDKFKLDLDLYIKWYFSPVIFRKFKKLLVDEEKMKPERTV